MKKVNLLVSLKIPDTVAITAFHTLERMGYDELVSLTRKDYYSFEIEGLIKDFREKISKVDILVNANKNNYEFDLKNKKNDNYFVNVLVKNFENGSGLLSTLKERLGFNNIGKIEKGILWLMEIKAENKNMAEKLAEKITNDLLINENYQEFEII